MHPRTHLILTTLAAGVAWQRSGRFTTLTAGVARQRSGRFTTLTAGVARQRSGRFTTLTAGVVRQRSGRFPWAFWAGGALADVDHLLWHALRHRRLDPLAAWRYFTSHPPDGPGENLWLHRAPLIAGLAAVGCRDLALGLAFHRLLDDLTDLWRRGQRLYEQRNRDRLRAIVFGREQHRCQHCGTGNAALELHHRIPEAAGGRNHPDNLLALCPACHDRAHGRG
ncbi:MAG: HNH endonuclease [Caldilineales bacterium]|nr:HNH endonuclease [Caldilineales bacterium]